jgi:hypothetical protein
MSYRIKVIIAMFVVSFFPVLMFMIDKYPNTTRWITDIFSFLDFNSNSFSLEKSFVFIICIFLLFVIWASSKTIQLFTRRSKMRRLAQEMNLKYEAGDSLVKPWDNTSTEDLFFNRISGQFNDKKIELYDSYDYTGSKVRFHSSIDSSGRPMNLFKKCTHIIINGKEIEHYYLNKGIFMPFKKLKELIFTQVDI